MLEREILPWLRDHALPEGSRILDIGIDWYTRGYPTFFPGRRYVTLEIDRAKAAFARDEDHLWGSAASLGELVEPASFDFILCNGVLGWGLDTAEDTRHFIEQAADALTPGGLLLIGWNDDDAHRPAFLPDASTPALEPWTFPPRARSTIDTGAPRRHVYDFYRRRQASPSNSRATASAPGSL